MKNLYKLFLCVCLFIVSPLLFVGCGDDLILVTGVDIHKETIYANISDTIDLAYRVYPNNATNKKVTFWSTDSNIASVDENGKVTVKSEGEASIIIRSVDGGYEDYCKIITNIDPEAITWDTDNGKLTEVTGQNYSATTAIAEGQVTKLKVNYLIDGIISESVTNKNVKFTSSNPKNISIINETEGVLKAINNEITGGDQAYSDITATIETAKGDLSITCRVYINESSSLDNLFVNYKNGNNKVLNERNGSETIYLTSGGASIDFWSYILDDEQYQKNDYTMTITSSDENLFKVENVVEDGGIYYFTLTPSSSEEGPATLHINTTCSDKQGKTIRCDINVNVQGEIVDATPTATTRNVGGTEILLNGEVFSINLNYFDAEGKEITGATRDIYFYDIDEEFSDYITSYGNNQFKVKAVPEDINKIFTISGYFYVENVETSKKIDFKDYHFYIRNELQGLIVSREEKTESTDQATGEKVVTIPENGVSSVTIPVGGFVVLYAYATAYDFTENEPTTIRIQEGSDLFSVAISNINKIQINALSAGTDSLIITASDGLITIEYEVIVNIVPQIAEIKFFENYSGGNFSSEISSLQTSLNRVNIFVDIVEINDNFAIENPSSIKLEVEQGTLIEEVDTINNKIYRYIEVDLSSLETGSFKKITVKCNRFMTEKSLIIQKTA